MKINSIKVNNISSYSGECFFDFTLSENKSVILVGGQNGTGKTSLFTALKLALYGHLCFSYQSVNGQYLTKVKELISSDAFASAEVSAFIELDIEIPNERENELFRIRREWEHSAGRLSENLYIYQNGVALSESQIPFFQNYLYTILPPNLFDFYFFDGEQIADFFASSNYNAYVKKAVLTLCNYDTFDIIRKFCEGYTSNSEIIDNAIQAASLYRAECEKMDSLKAEQELLEQRIQGVESDIENNLTQKAELEHQFKNAGGLSEAEKDEMLKLSRELEHKKGEHSVAVRSFVESRMPFFIAASLGPEISAQMRREEEVKKYLGLRDKLNSQQISDAVLSTMRKYGFDVDSDIISELTNSIGNAVKPDIEIDAFEFLHDLSLDQNTRVNSVLNYIAEFKPKSILKHISEKEKTLHQTIAINKKLREAMSDADAAAYSEQLTKMTNIQFDLQKQYDNAAADRDTNRLNLEISEKELKVLYEKLKENTKNKSVYELTQRISTSLDTMIQTLISSKFKQIESEILIMLKKILRKNNFIDLIELDEDFNIFIYKEQNYQVSELENLTRNIGQDELVKRIGISGTTRLLEFFEIDSISKLKNYLKKPDGQLGLQDDKVITLYKRIELSQLSKGEKQIFILSLYYAIIKISGKNIPFIIDTPYARIDTEHREQITKEFFPIISNQVIIFSTDEEITKPYYDALKPFIAQEYLLEYNDKQSRTTVSGGYFFKEG